MLSYQRRIYAILLLIEFSLVIVECYRLNFPQIITSKKIITNYGVHSNKPLLSMCSTSISPAINQDYSAGAITVLSGLEPVRVRPGMYIGSTGVRGLHHLVQEVVDNSVDEALAGYCKNITLTMEVDGSITVQDDGRGIPCDIHPISNKTALETVLCTLHAGGKFGGDNSGYMVSGGLHGVGISVVNALSESMTVHIARDGKLYTLQLSRGIPLSDIETRQLTAEDTFTQGTRINFKPDSEIFKSGIEFEFNRLADRLQELSFLNPGLSITITDKRKGGREEVYCSSEGIKDLLKLLCVGYESIHPELPIVIKGSNNNVSIELTLQWSKDCYTESVIGFVNNIRTIDGGSHIDGFKSALSKVINSMSKKSGIVKETAFIPAEFIREGMTAIISVKVPQPEFEGQTKTRLGNPEVRQIVDTICTEKLTEIFEENLTVLNKIASKSLEALHASLAAKAARDFIRKKSSLDSTILPGKLSDCSMTDPNKTEIFIVEGNSAAGSAKQGRDRRFQAILPLRGKILNIERATSEQMYKNSEIQALISALGLGLRNAEYDPKALRYSRIILMCDADVDGAHIRLLLLTFLYRYRPELITNGNVYIACPPLYKINSKGKDSKPLYCQTQQDLDDYIAKSPHKNHDIQRFKGLGEMMADQLWSTTMNPETRTLKRVEISQFTAVGNTISTFMGEVIAPRKEFVLSNFNGAASERLGLDL